MGPTHNEFLEFLQLLGFTGYEGGVCFGLSAAALPPPLIGSTEHANQRLKDIKDCLDGYKKEQQENKKKGSESRTLSAFMAHRLGKEKKDDIVAYCKTVISYQDAQSIKAEEASGLVFAGVLTMYYGVKYVGSSLRENLIVLQNVINTMFKEGNAGSFSCVLSIKQHAIHLAYCAEKGMFCYFKINPSDTKATLGYYNADNLSDVTDTIDQEFLGGDKLGYVACGIQFYSLAEDSEKINQLKNTYKEELRACRLGSEHFKYKGRDNFGSTLLIAAILLNDMDYARELIAKNIGVLDNDKSGYSPLHYACLPKRIEIMEALLESGLNVNLKSNKGITPLMLAVDSQDLEIVKLLLKHGACPSIVTEDGKTALTQAIEQKNDSIVTLLTLNAGQKQILEESLAFFMEKQEEEGYLLPKNIVKKLNPILTKGDINRYNQKFFLMLYILIRKNEERCRCSSYSSLCMTFFKSQGRDGDQKIKAAEALLENPKPQKDCLALQDGRLGRIACSLFDTVNINTFNMAAWSFK